MPGSTEYGGQQLSVKDIFGIGKVACDLLLDGPAPICRCWEDVQLPEAEGCAVTSPKTSALARKFNTALAKSDPPPRPHSGALAAGNGIAVLRLRQDIHSGEIQKRRFADEIRRYGKVPPRGSEVALYRPMS